MTNIPSRAPFTLIVIPESRLYLRGQGTELQKRLLPTSSTAADQQREPVDLQYPHRGK